MAKQMTSADMVREMMAAWATIEAAAKVAYPNATPEERYQIAKSAMNHQLGIK